MATITARDLHAQLQALESEIGPDAWIFTRVGGKYTKSPISANIYPNGIGSKAIEVIAENFDSIVPTIRAAWMGKQAEIAASAIDDLAAEIMKRVISGRKVSKVEMVKQFSQPLVDKYLEPASLSVSACLTEPVIVGE